jgi:hypothetical protein
MKKFISLLFISALSASIALIAYNELFITESNENSGSIAKTNTFPVNYTNESTGGSNVDFSVAAEKTLHAVVHVKNTTISKGIY